MAQPNGNVVPLGVHPRAAERPSAQESSDLLTGCRELALERMGASLSGMLDKVEDELFTLAEGSVDREAQNLYLDARGKARAKRKLLETSFRQYFVDLFDRKVRGERDAPAGHEAELSLVGDAELEESLAVEEMARRMKSACEGELSTLSRRMGYLLERPELEDDANPISPATLVAALQNACAQIEDDFKVRLTLLRQLEHHAIADLQTVFREVNTHLVERHVLPELRPTLARAQSAPARSKPQSAPTAAPLSEGDVLRALAQIFGQSGMQGAVPGAVAPPQAFVAELTRMHRDGGARAAPAGDDSDAGPVNVVKDLKSAPSGAHLSSVDAMTIDIVAMLFDYIFDDRHIPARVKAVLARLQIPILKVALLDKAFFSAKAHPARRFLDRLAESAFGLDETYAEGQATLAMIENAVARVLNEFEADVALFESLVAEVEAFIDERGRAEATLVESTVRLIQEREREEIAQMAAEEAVARHMEARRWVPSVVRQMLSETWVHALADAHLAEGEGSARWHALVATMDDLLWSVEPKLGAEDRKRLVTMLPGMLKRVTEGLHRGDLPVDACGVFMAALVDCHAAAVKAGLRGMGMVPPAMEPVQPPMAPQLERSVLPAGEVRVEEVRLRANGKAPARNLFTRTGIWTNLQRGTWVEFVNAGGSVMRSRLTWISPAKGVYLFTNPLLPGNATSISPDALAEQMRLGEARIIDDAPLLDRAVDSMLAKLRPAQA